MSDENKNKAGMIVLLIFLLICSGIGIAAFIMSFTKKCGEVFETLSHLNAYFKNNNFESKNYVISPNRNTFVGIRPLLLFTMTVNVGKNISSLGQISKDERKNQYLKTILNWVKSYNYDIGIIENSGYDFTELKDMYPNLIIISFNYNKFDKSLQNILSNIDSKGIHELISINYFLRNTNISKFSHIIKITGRYYVPNFEDLVIKNLKINHDAIVQNDRNRCEIVGCSTKMINHVFSLNIGHMHIEHEFKKRINILSNKNILQLPILPIEKTRRGCGSYHESL